MEVDLRRLMAPTLLSVAATLSRLAGFLLLIPLIHLATTGSAAGGRIARLGLVAALESSAGSFALLISAIVLAVSIGGVASYVSRLQLGALSAAAETRLGELVLRSHLRFGQRYYDDTSLGASVKRISTLPTQGLRALAFVHRSMDSCLSFALYLAAMLFLSWPLALAAMVVLTVYLYYFDRLVDRIEGLADLEEASEERRINLAVDLVENRPLIHAMGTQAWEASRFAAAATESVTARLRRQRILDLVEPLRDLLNVLVIVGLVAAAGMILGTDRGGDVVRYIVFFLVFRRAMTKFSGVLSVPSNLERVSAKIRRLLAALDDSDKCIVPTGALSFPGLERELRVEGLDFRYRPKRPILRDISFRVEAGRTLFVVGATGSGKTTLFNLLLRLYDCPPRTIAIDGVDIRRYDTSSLLARVAFCSSTPYLFDESVRYNVTYGLREVGEDAIWEAAELAQARELIESLDAGLDERVGDRGVKLSSGETQRLALMRAFLRRSDLLLLDEATSALDTATEADILDELFQLDERRTILVIAHRLTMIPPTADVLVLKRGRVVQHGTRDALLAERGELSRLWRVGSRIHRGNADQEGRGLAETKEGRRASARARS